jgi:hypothetical protein
MPVRRARYLISLVSYDQQDKVETPSHLLNLFAEGSSKAGAASWRSSLHFRRSDFEGAKLTSLDPPGSSEDRKSEAMLSSTTVQGCNDDGDKEKDGTVWSEEQLQIQQVIAKSDKSESYNKSHDSDESTSHSYGTAGDLNVPRLCMYNV